MNCAADELGSDFSDMARAGRDDTRGGVGRSEPTPGIRALQCLRTDAEHLAEGALVERVKTATHFPVFPRKRVGFGRKRATTMNRARSTPLRPATCARSTGNAAADTGLSYRASNELFQCFPENVTEKGGNDATSDNIGSPPASFRLYSGLLKSSRTRKVIPSFRGRRGTPTGRAEGW
jgi:hypothetical protein